MSKASLIELIKSGEDDIDDAFCQIIEKEGWNGVIAFLTKALKDVEQDTKHGCAVSIAKIDGDSPIINMAQCACLNYQDKDLAGL